MACAYPSLFLSRSFEEHLQQTKRRRQLWHLRQEGAVADFNYAFNALSAKLDVTEDYLVKVYVYGLKEEVAESVKLCNPLTLLEARRMARMQELSIQWRLQKARVLKDKEDGGVPLPSILEQATIIQEVSKVQESGGSCSDSTHMCSKVSEIQESSRISEQSQTNHQDVPGDKHAKFLDVPEQKKFDSHNDGLVADSCQPDTVIVCSLSSSHLPLSQTVSAISKAIVSVCIVPLGSFPSLLSLFQSLGPTSLQSIDYSHISTKSELVMRQAEELTWLGLIELEKSKAQLVSIFPTFQLSCNFSLWQKNVVGLQLDSFSSVSGVTDQNMGFNFQENGPSSLQQWVNSAKPVYVSIHWSFHVKLSCTRTLLQLWFKGKLIVMLYGRFCSLRGKDKKMPKG